jgi:hypothetical protein
MFKLKAQKSLALIAVIPLALSLQACGSIESKVEKACALTERASDMLKADDDSYTDVYSEAADILQELAAEDAKYEGPYEAALLWASGNNLSAGDISVIMELEELCTPSEE